MRFRTIFPFFILAELLSFAAYFFHTLNAVGFFVILLAALALSLRRFEYGLGIVLAELILGGKGYLFSASIAGTVISLRMGLFVVVMAVWFVDVLRAKKRTIVSFFAQQPLRWWWLLGVAIVWGLAVGLARGNDFGNLFLDANGYFYAALVLPFVWVFRDQVTTRSVTWSHIVTIFFTATTWVAIKTLLAVYIFTHAGNNFIAANLISFYRWVRDTGVGEITWLEGNFARVFFQSHIYNVAAFFVILALCVKGEKSGWKMRMILALNAAVIVVSLSRSFWVGVVVGLGILVAQVFRPDIRPKGLIYITRIGSQLLSTFVISVALIFIVARFPLPQPSAIDLGAAARARLAAESAATSRWNLLPPLWRAIRAHPVVGSGFGTTVTYISNDPRIRAESPTGEYTTYAFEWGWLDLWLKVGAVGLVLYVLLLFKIGHGLYAHSKGKSLNTAALVSLVALAAISVFTPYLNHPLGFGILILATTLLTEKQ